MAMLEQRIQQQFFESADLHSQAAEALSRPVAQAAQALAACLTAGGKMLAAGSDVGAALAPVICAAFTGSASTGEQGGTSTAFDTANEVDVATGGAK